MRLVEINGKPKDRQLRPFGLIALFALPALAWWFGGRPGLSGWTSGQHLAVGLLGAIGLALAVVGLARPQLLRPVFLTAMIMALPIGLVVSDLILPVVYFGLFFPIAVLFRIMGRDALGRKLERNTDSFWTPKAQPSSPQSYFRQS